MAWIRRYVAEDGSIPLQGYHEHCARATGATPYFRREEDRLCDVCPGLRLRESYPAQRFDQRNTEIVERHSYSVGDSMFGCVSLTNASMSAAISRRVPFALRPARTEGRDAAPIALARPAGSVL